MAFQSIFFLDFSPDALHLLSRLYISTFWHFFSSCSPLTLLSAGFLIWNYYVTMPMPASTFTLAVGHWHQVTAEIPRVLEEGVREGTDCGKTAKLGASPGQLTETELVSGLGSSTSAGVKGSPLQTGRYFIIFPVFFYSLKPSSLQTIINPSLALRYFMVKLSFHHTKNGVGEVRMIDRVQHSICFSGQVH